MQADREGNGETLRMRMLTRISTRKRDQDRTTRFIGLLAVEKQDMPTIRHCSIMQFMTK